MKRRIVSLVLGLLLSIPGSVWATEVPVSYDLDWLYSDMPDPNELETLDSIFENDGWRSHYSESTVVFLNGNWKINRPFIRAGSGRQEPTAFKVHKTGRTLMPIRFFTEAIGGEVEYVDGAVHLSYRGTEVVLRLRDTKALVNGREVELDQAPVMLYGRTMVPLRFIMEAFGAEVEFFRAERNDVAYAAGNHIVNIKLEGAECLERSLCQAYKLFPFRDWMGR